MIDISGFGTGITIVALQAFPEGFSVSEFSDDKDPLVCEATETNAWDMLYDGSLYFYTKADPIKLSLSVIPGGNDDTNLKILLQGSLSSSGILPLPRTTSMILNYPSGFVMLSNGTIYRGPVGDSIQASGRKSGNTYDFVFGSFFGAQSITEVLASVAGAAASFL